MNREQTIKSIEENKIVVITRGIYGVELLKLSEALYEGGIRAFEITYDPADPNTLSIVKENIQMLNERFKGKLLLGVGTVLNCEQVRNAKVAGASFIVSPNFNEMVVKETIKQGMVSMPGCMTPTEICAADEAGADFIKFFPAGTLGLKYCKDIFAPIHHVKYIATVGITEETFSAFLDAGFVGAGISSVLVDPVLRKEGKYSELTKRAARFVEIVKSHK